MPRGKPNSCNKRNDGGWVALCHSSLSHENPIPDVGFATVIEKLSCADAPPANVPPFEVTGSSLPHAGRAVPVLLLAVACFGLRLRQRRKE
jgi:hypothetical protein